MKKSVFITGISGSGKSTVCKALVKLGYKAYDIEAADLGLFIMVRKDTGEPFLDFDNADMNKVKNTDWICDREKLEKLIGEQTKRVVFYCGVASNNKQIIPLFDQSILLKADPKAINTRLVGREGTNDYGNTEAGRQRILSYKDWFENEMLNEGLTAVDANPSILEVAKRIIEVIS